MAMVVAAKSKDRIVALITLIRFIGRFSF